MTSAQRGLDAPVRQVISRELGHERIRITAVYLTVLDAEPTLATNERAGGFAGLDGGCEDGG